VLIGGSYIGCEVAASLTALGKSCTIVMIEQVALSRGFGDEVGGWFQRLLEEHGVEVLGGEELAAFEGDGRVRAVVTKSGRTIEADMVVIGAGVRPDVMLAKRAGLEVEDGIVCDAALETSVPGIFAAGDVCSYDSVIHGRRLRVEHWDVALQQGRHAARGMLGDRQPFREVPYFFSDLADWSGFEYVGPAQQWDEVVIRGNPDDGEFSAWYLHEGRVKGTLAVGRSDDLIPARSLIESGVDVSEQREALADLNADLNALA
jgi:3-phenylpropionate/trans-cinnamate dioxygenase ferredoxin reductase subunit